MFPDPGASRAVLIGTSTYDFLEDLPAVANNLTSLADLLTGPASWNLSSDACDVLADPPSATAAMDTLWEASDTARDTLLVYYAGHGLVTPEGELYLGLPRSKQQRVDTGIPYNWLRDALLDGRAERTVVILDCCYGGLALGTMGSSDLAVQADVEGTYLLAAASENRQALAPPGEQHTAFTGELLSLLTTGIAGGPEQLDLDSILRELRRSLSAKGRPVPQGRERNSNGRLALSWNPAFSRPPVSGTPSGKSEDRREWPDPAGIRTVEGFFSALGQVRITSALSHVAISHRSGGQIAPGTVGGLLNRKELPKTWRTTDVYLTACGVPDEQLDVWRQCWERLRSAPLAERTAESEETREHSQQHSAASSPWRRTIRKLAGRRIRN
ncbi:caspase family protein [Streptomyces sp. col6]|uniref:caspase family protein n=1 Tax=Streptomyces sp. col6 TaxID=2478958 RepID=UPI001CD15FDE|nr:caspase family protein [Streptomyces sp. col6]